MSQLPSPLSAYVDRFNKQFSELNLEFLSEEMLIQLIHLNKISLNNMFMAGLGASTLILRLGSIIQLCKKLENDNSKEDSLLMKQIMDNLVDNLPSDTSWRVIWSVTSEEGSPWQKCVLAPKGKKSLLEKLVTFRNKYVHGYISLIESDVKHLLTGISVLNEMVNVTSKLFQDSQIQEMNNRLFFVQKGLRVSLHPFIQKGSKDGLPYVFQGMHNNKRTAELISTHYGDVENQDGNLHYDKIFAPIQKALKGGVADVFDHSNRIGYYSECFVGRERENQAILEWASSKSHQNILPIFSSAGMGKGALIANVIQELGTREINIPTLYHFCGSGVRNNLHATLYHFIIQGKKQQIWKTDNEEINFKLKRLPSRYTDLIMLFHSLLDDYFIPSRKNHSGHLAIVLDGLDEASVAYPNLHISDWFNTYDENGEVMGSWQSKSSVKWIFTYRKGFYRFPKSDLNVTIDIVQPLLGLSSDAAEAALSIFKTSKEFLSEVVKRGAVVD